MKQNKIKRILMLGNCRLVIFGFRGELITKLIQDGYEITVAFPNGPFGEGEQISHQYGCQFVEIPIDRWGTNPMREMLLIWQYLKLMNCTRPNVVLSYTAKCDLYGGIACRMMRIPFIPNVTGLGKGLAEGGLVQTIVTVLYRIAVKKASCVFFQNTHDKQFFDDHRIRYSHGMILPGSGVNLTKFQPLPYPNGENIVFTYLGRVMKAKGIEQYLDAAAIVRNNYPNTEFHICGYCEEDYTERIQKAQNSGLIVNHGLVNNVEEFIKNSFCIVLPSFHPEGVSNALLEAAACARPIITTDHAGCRETVVDGVTGYLVKERDSLDLAEKMIAFLKLPNQEKRDMGLLGRRKAEREFNREIVVEKYREEIKVCVGSMD